MADDEFTCDLFRFLQLLCEGHNNGDCFSAHSSLPFKCKDDEPLAPLSYTCPFALETLLERFWSKSFTWLDLTWLLISLIDMKLLFVFWEKKVFPAFLPQTFRTTWELRQAAPRPSMWSSVLWITYFDYRSLWSWCYSCPCSALSDTHPAQNPELATSDKKRYFMYFYLWPHYFSSLPQVTAWMNWKHEVETWPSGSAPASPQWPSTVNTADVASCSSSSYLLMSPDTWNCSLEAATHHQERTTHL